MKIFITIIVLLVLVLGFYYYAPDSMKFWEGQTAALINSGDNSNNQNQVPQHETITAKHQYKNGTHIIAGEVNLPTPCYILTTDALIAESYPEQVTVQFTSKTTGDACAEVTTATRFKVEFAAAENATIKATWNGAPVELNLIPAGADEDLTNFELFIKG